MATNHNTRRNAVLRYVPDGQELYRVIESVAPKVDAKDRKKALRDLQQAIGSFREAHLYAKREFRVRGSISYQRKALGKLSKSLEGSREALKTLPPYSQAALARRLRRSIGEMLHELKTCIDAVHAEHQAAIESKDHPANPETTILASEVAHVLLHTLKGKLALSSDRATVRAPRNGAAYARLLRATLEAAGANTPDDLVPLMEKGKALLASVSQARDGES